MLKFSANLSLLFTEVDVLERFKLAKQHGFDGIEIQFPYEIAPEVFKSHLDEQGLRCVLFNVAADDLLAGGEGLASVPEKQAQFKEAVAQTLEYATLLKPEAINVLPGRCLTPARLSEYQATFTENLAYAVAAFAPLGIKIVFEAINTYDMPGFIIHSTQQQLAILEALNLPDLYLQYDIYHMQKMGEAVADFIKQHAAQIGHIQFADCPGRAQPGTGQLDFVTVFSAIIESGYQGWVGAEYKPMGETKSSLAWLKSVS